MIYKVIHQLKERNFDNRITKSETAVLDYLEENFRRIPESTVIKVAQESYTSQATINRTCKLLGFAGFGELKYAISEDIDLLDSGTQGHIRDTEYILSKIDFNSADDLVNHLYDNRNHLLLYGLGASHISAQYLQRQLLYLGIPAIVVTELQMLRNFQGYTMLILSNSGETQRCIQVINKAQKANIHVVSISKKDSTVMSASSYCFFHDVQVNKMEGLSREQQLHVILMVNEVVNQLKDKYMSG